MRVIVMFIILIVNMIFQTTLLNFIAIAGTKPNVVIILIVSYSILRNDVEGAIFGFCLGLLLDIYFGEVIGSRAFICALTGFVVAKTFKGFYKENYFIPLFLVALSVLGSEFLYYILNFFLRGRLNIIYYFKDIVLPEILYTVVITLPIYRFIYVINSKLEDIEYKGSGVF